MDLVVEPLHKYPQFLEQCCNLINEEWQRSKTARMRSLESSCDTLPTCLILLQKDNVIGHSKISSIPNIQDACFVQSVVIKTILRGKGYGKYLMTKTEEYCKNCLNVKTIYLSTQDQEVFYSKLGYKICQPISMYGSCNMKSSPTMHNNGTKIINAAAGPTPPPIPKLYDTPLCPKIYMNKIL